MQELMSKIANEVWGTPMLYFLTIANIILLYQSKFLPIKGFFHALKLIFKKKESENKAEGELSHFETLSNALAATIGLGNISGVAVAIFQGGAGALFWMWVAGFIGMNTKFFECTLAVIYRGENTGGPMYYIEKGLGKKYRILGFLFALFGLVGTLSLFQVNQLTSFIESSYSIPGYTSGIVFSLLTFYILSGGLKRISFVTSKIVPIMGFGYSILCFIIIGLNLENLSSVFLQIFQEAFTGKAALGGAIGLSVKEVIQIGLKRASFSNEAGIGTAPMAHADAKTNEPISEGYVAMLGPFFDTIIVCSMTGIVILLGLQGSSAYQNGIDLTTSIFVKFLGEFGKHALGLMVFLFAFSTMIGMANYNKKCWDYLFAKKKYFNNFSFIVFYSTTLLIGSLLKINIVIDLIDICYGLMAIPNIFAVVLLSKKVNEKLKIYNQKYKI